MTRIATKLFLSFLLIIVMTSLIFSVVGIRLIDILVVAEAQSRVRNDLNAAREIYLERLRKVHDVVRFAADRFLLLEKVYRGDVSEAAGQLARLKEREGLDVLYVTDRAAKVLLRAGGEARSDEAQASSEVLRAALQRCESVAATSVVPAEELRRHSAALAGKAYFKFIDVPKTRPRPETEETSGMMLEAAAPVLDLQGNLLGAICGGVLLSRNFEIVDKIKETVFQGMKYNGRDIGTATIFLDDLRISTNVRNHDGSRAVGTRIAEDVYNRVVKEGLPWIDRAFVVNDWYITAYEPIRDIVGRIVGILYVGVLERKFTDAKMNTIWTFVCVTGGGGVLALGLSYLLSRTISVPIWRLMEASRAVASGDLDAKVEVKTRDELSKLAETFNNMASALKRRDEQLKEYAKRKIMESERLAFIGQLAAGVAHELNNPLQGVVTYAHLLLEDSSSRASQGDLLRRIVKQADRCSAIIRGLLDFSRQKSTQKKPEDIAVILKECVSLVERQPLFHNIQIALEIAPSMPPVMVDHSTIQQVFMNLIINAAEAMDGTGRLAISARLDSSGKFVETAVSDTGHGIKPEHLDKIFDPFFTTKEVGHGTGLGLSICYGIVKEHLGSISVESEVGKGSTFTVRLPVACGEVA